MASGDTNDEVALLRQRIEVLEEKEARYRDIYENSPISLWVEDWSAVKAHLNQLLVSGGLDGHSAGGRAKPGRSRLRSQHHLDAQHPANRDCICNERRGLACALISFSDERARAKPPCAR